MERLRAGDGAARVVVLSGRRPLGARLAGLAGRRCAPIPPPPSTSKRSTALTRSSRSQRSRRPIRARHVAQSRPCGSRPSGSRLRLLAAVLIAEDGDHRTAVRVAVDDLLVDASAPARRLLEILAIGGPATRVAAAESCGRRIRTAARSTRWRESSTMPVWSAPSGDRSPSAVPIIGDAWHSGSAPSVQRSCRVLFAEALAGLESVDPREIAAHVRAVADRLPGELLGRCAAWPPPSARLRASEHARRRRGPRGRRRACSSAAPGGARDDAHGSSMSLRALGGRAVLRGRRARGRCGEPPGASSCATRSPRRALDEVELDARVLASDRGRSCRDPAGIAGGRGTMSTGLVTVRSSSSSTAVTTSTNSTRSARSLVALRRRRRLAGRARRRGAGAFHARFGRRAIWRSPKPRPSVALAIAGDGSPAVDGGDAARAGPPERVRGDLDAGSAHNDGRTYVVEGRAPRSVEPSSVVHRASLEVLRGDLAERRIWPNVLSAMTRARARATWIVRCASWVALISAMRGDLTRARSLIAEAGRMFPLEAQPPSDDGRAAGPRPVGPARRRPDAAALHLPPGAHRRAARLLLPTLTARLAIQHDDAGVIDAALDELDALPMSPPAVALAQRVRALQRVSTRRRRDAVDALDDSAATLERLGFAALAAETRLEWAELAAERGDAGARAVVLGLVPYFDAQGLDDWGDRARRLARTIGVRIGGRRGGRGRAHPPRGRGGRSRRRGAVERRGCAAALSQRANGGDPPAARLPPARRRLPASHDHAAVGRRSTSRRRCSERYVPRTDAAHRARRGRWRHEDHRRPSSRSRTPPPRRQGRGSLGPPGGGPSGAPRGRVRARRRAHPPVDRAQCGRGSARPRLAHAWRSARPPPTRTARPRPVRARTRRC